MKLLILICLLLPAAGPQIKPMGTPVPKPAGYCPDKPVVIYNYPPEAGYDEYIIKQTYAGCRKYVADNACPVELRKMGYRNWHVICRRH